LTIDGSGENLVPGIGGLEADRRYLKAAGEIIGGSI
jgi:hypothetical protein